MVKYTYDAWGNAVTDVLDCNANAIAELNPFRYRSYYYDTETGLYFLKSRYYDPELGRFITIDDVSYLDPDTINGLNLYAYCGNNPVDNVDPTGHNPILQFFISSAAYVSFAVASIWNEDVRNDMKAIGWNPFNTCENTAVSCTSVSFYRGVPIINADKLGMNGSLSLGLIFLSNGNYGTGITMQDVLKHEYGHSIQLRKLGLIKYLILIGIPSYNKNYDNSPWELNASILGGSPIGVSLGDISNAEDIINSWEYFYNACSFNYHLWVDNWDTYKSWTS